MKIEIDGKVRAFLDQKGTRAFTLSLRTAGGG